MSQSEQKVEVKQESKKEKKASSELTHSAISLVKTKKAEWKLFEIRFNPETGEVGSLSYTLAGESRDDAEDSFKRKVVDSVFHMNDNV